MPTHEYFRELSALAEIGEISEKEQAELELHLRSCAECRRAARGYGEVLFEWLPLRSPAEQNTEDELGPSARSRWHLAWAAPIAAVIVLMVALSLLWTAWNGSGLEEQSRALAALRSENASLVSRLQSKEQEVEALMKSLEDQERGKPVPTSRGPAPVSTALQRARATIAELQAERDELRVAASASHGERDRLAHELQRAKASRDGDLRRASELEARARELRAELDRREGSIKALSSRLAFLDGRIKAEGKESSGSDSVLERLFADPSLRVIDVYAVLNKSTRPRSFCRILQVADAPPVIYAYRLAGGDFSVPGTPRHFQIWGMRHSIEVDSLGLVDPAQASASSVHLGELGSDDPDADRWVLQLRDVKALNDVRYLLITEARESDAPSQPVLWGYIDK